MPVDKLPDTDFMIRVNNIPQDLQDLLALLELLGKLHWARQHDYHDYKAYLSGGYSSVLVLMRTHARSTRGEADNPSSIANRPVIDIADAMALISPNSY